MSSADQTAKGNLSIKVGGNIRYSIAEQYRVDGAQLNSNSGTAFQQKSGQGQTVRNEDKAAKVTPPPPPMTDLRIIKVEGPFDDNGALVKEIKTGAFYAYRATPGRPPKDIEIKLLQWAISLDGGAPEKVPDTALHNGLSNGQITIKLAINKDCSQAGIYAFFNQLKEEIKVTVPVKKLKLPILILQGSRRKGKNRENTGPAQDMLSNDYPAGEPGIEKLRKELYSETFNVEKQDGWYNMTNRPDNAKNQSDYKIKKIREFLKQSDADLFSTFKSDIEYYSKGEMETVAKAMVDKMQSNSGGVYESNVLAQHVLGHESSKNFVGAINNVLRDYLKSNKGKIDTLEITDDGKGLLYDMLVKRKVDSPRFSDNFSGLGITINDVWAYQVYITGYKTSGNNYTLNLRYVYYDHFGLDYPDIQKYDHDIFYAWFVLQHFKGYQPFITEVNLKGELKGTF